MKKSPKIVICSHVHFYWKKISCSLLVIDGWWTAVSCVLYDRDIFHFTYLAPTKKALSGVKVCNHLKLKTCLGHFFQASVWTCKHQLFFGCLKNTHLGLVVQHILEAWNCSTEIFFQKSFLHYLDALHKCMQKIVLMWSSLVKQFYLFKNNFSSKNILKCALSI